MRSDTSLPRITKLISSELDAKLHALAHSRTYGDGQIIHSRGDIKPGLSIVRKGAAHVGTFGKDGSFVSITVLGVGQTFGELTLFAALPRTQDITAVGATKIDQIPGPKFLALYEKEPTLSHALMMIALMRSHALVESLTDGRRMNISIRLAKTLLDLCQGDRGSAHITIRQTDLAATLGVSRYTVNKTLKTLGKTGFIALGYGEIKIPDLDGFRNWTETRSATETLFPLK